MNGSDESVAVLREIWNEMKALNLRVDRTREELGARIDQTNARLDRTNASLDTLWARVDAGFARVDQRFDHLLIEHGREHLEFRERIARLEQRAGIPPTAAP